MKLLILTQKVDRADDVLGFFHDWIAAFANEASEVTVICLEKGTFDLPSNVRVFSLGKEDGVSRFEKLRRFYALLSKHRKEYDTVFVHMNPEYVILGGLLWRMWGKRIALWYVHRHVGIRLRLATLLAHDIFSVAASSFKVKTKKLHTVGHGISVANFGCPDRTPSSVPRLLYVGRMTPIKQLEVLIDALGLLKNKGVAVAAELIGLPVSAEDKRYRERLIEMIQAQQLKELVTFVGGVKNVDMRDHYCAAALTVNLTPAGSFDKAIIESMAAGVPPLVSNPALATYFGTYAPLLIFRERDAVDLANHIETLLREGNQALGSYLVKTAHEQFDTKGLVHRISSILCAP